AGDLRRGPDAEQWRVAVRGGSEEACTDDGRGGDRDAKHVGRNTNAGEAELAQDATYITANAAANAARCKEPTQARPPRRAARRGRRGWCRTIVRVKAERPK